MADSLLPWLVILTTLVLAVQVRAGRYLFALVALGLSAALIATHNPALAARMDRRIKLENGLLVPV